MGTFPWGAAMHWNNEESLSRQELTKLHSERLQKVYGGAQVSAALRVRRS